MCIDTQLYNCDKRHIAKQVFDLPEDCRLVFAGAVNVKEERKGSVFFLDSLSVLWDYLAPEEREKVYIMIAGKNTSFINDYPGKLPPFHFKFIDFITDVRLLSLAYQAADLFVCSSLEDAGPMMVAEALSCGTPIVGFPVGLMFNQEIVRNGVTGYVVSNKSVVDLAKAVYNILALDGQAYSVMSQECRKTAVHKLSKAQFISNFDNLVQCLKG